MNKRQVIGSLMLFTAALIWGGSYVAQKDALNYVGPITFMFARSAASVIFLAPMVLAYRQFDDIGKSLDSAQKRRRTKLTLKVGTVAGIVFGSGVCLQQIGQIYTSVGKAAFITGIYIVWVPIGSFIVMRIRSGPKLWLAVFLAVIGLYVLTINGNQPINKGDIYCFLGAILMAIHILILGRYANSADGVLLSLQQYLSTAVVMMVLMFIFEKPSLNSIFAGWKPLLYTSLLSNAVGGTLQIFGQKRLDASVASLIMSLEAPLAVIAGLILLNERLTTKELIGCVLMFVAILLAQWPTSVKNKKQA
ncbi:MAG: DMT family transporter [Fastidiosipilaceae bacterium]|jgi:drug/metabolite transporter (DMT)-like permease|nr:DMT family transporter [Clostridiaceae bacterium]